MSFFPAYIKLENKNILVIGGGKIAGDKISHLLDFTKNITVISPKVDDRVKEFITKNGLKYINREYKKGDIDQFYIVIVAADDIELQKRIYLECQEKKILCNSVDSIEYCDFIFPSYIKKDDLIISFSTSGASPALSKYLRRAIEKIIPNDIGKFLKELKDIREKLPKGRERMKLLDTKAKEYIQKYFKRIDDV
ncbi:precorrin-2 dehydrogenase/sirohydrochlorin ferrochelatase family protein [Nitrosophilus kaiyonis]|uniref:precorrin-2 dehydrogenase/sirohydrochlorin ferrochelatase family protein n=1 Tax=Nitrosophilus kaiyonis TaxID=2930200 RepID=UPI0024930E02|nr:bifunctional precorrin-2 dehydrogenase/sirohydrochlorin ferrochelatase [Nitrosophilus kaiyonis]